VLRSSGRFAEALLCFRRVVELDPDWPEGYRSRAATGQQADEPQLRRLAAVLKNRGRSVSDRISAGFALGMLLDNAERCDEAFPCFAEANALHRQQQAAAGERFDIEALRRQMDDLIELATPDFFSAAASWGNASQAPVFIVGMPRSGTSLVEQIAASHSRVFGAGELPATGEIWGDAVSAQSGPPGREMGRGPCPAARRPASRVSAGARQRSGSRHRQDAGQHLVSLAYRGAVPVGADHLVPARSARRVSLLLFPPFHRGAPLRLRLGGLWSQGVGDRPANGPLVAAAAA
jgi:hypothetical protein